MLKLKTHTKHDQYPSCVFWKKASAITMNTKIWTMFMKVMRIQMMCNLKQTDNVLIFQRGFAKDKGTNLRNLRKCNVFRTES